MKVYLDTATEDFFVALFDDNYSLVDKIHLENYRKKVSLIPEQFSELLNRNSLQISQINQFITNIGPGFFTGVRSGMVFFRTISLQLNKSFSTISTFEILHEQNKEMKFIYLDAQGDKLYKFNSESYGQENIKALIEVVEKAENINISKINFEQLSNNFGNYKKYFNNQEPLKQEVLYIKKPQIGVKK